MKKINTFFIQFERLLHPNIKELIANFLMYFFAVKEIKEYQKPSYQGHDHVLDDLSGLLNVAHRGFSGEYPENTLLAFQKAIDLGVDMLELDVQITLDGEIVVCHDPHLDRFTGASDFLRDHPYKTLLEYDVGAWMSPKFSGLKIPTLAEVFEIVPLETLINIEIKHEASSFFNWETEKAVLEKIRTYGREKQVLISAFNPMIVNRIRKLAPDISTAYLITQKLNPLLIFLLYRVRASYIHVDFRYLKPNIIKALERNGLKVLSYTLNTPSEFQAAYDLGLKGIITDFPDRLRSFLKDGA